MSLPVRTAERINHEHELARRHAHDAVAHAVRCGQLLLEAKQQLPHGAFMAWVKASCAFRYSTAARYMTAARQSSTGVEISTLGALFESGRKRSRDLQSLDRFNAEIAGNVDGPRSFLDVVLDHLSESKALEWQIQQKKLESERIYAALDSDPTNPDLIRRLGELVRSWHIESEIAVLRLRMLRHLGAAFAANMTLADAIESSPAAIEESLGVPGDITLEHYLARLAA